jgi:hypothetical protein
MFKAGKFRRSSFVFREYGCAAQRYPISLEVIDNEMISQRRFNLPKYMVYLTDKHAMVHGAIRLESGQEYSLSGFPKQLILGKDANRLPGGTDNTDPMSSQLSAWEVPTLQDVPSPIPPPDNSPSHAGPSSEASAYRSWARSYT